MPSLRAKFEERKSAGALAQNHALHPPEQRESQALPARSTERATEGKYLNYSHSAEGSTGLADRRWLCVDICYIAVAICPIVSKNEAIKERPLRQFAFVIT